MKFRFKCHGTYIILGLRALMFSAVSICSRCPYSHAMSVSNPTFGEYLQPVKIQGSCDTSTRFSSLNFSKLPFLTGTVRSSASIIRPSFFLTLNLSINGSGNTSILSSLSFIISSFQCRLLVPRIYSTRWNNNNMVYAHLSNNIII